MIVLRWASAIAILGLAWILLGLPALGFIAACYPEPDLGKPAAVTEDGSLLRCGASWRQRLGDADDGVWLVHLEGDAVARGQALGLLLGDELVALETEMMRTFCTLVPSWPARHVLLGLVGLANRDLPRYFHDDELLAIAATSQALHATGRVPAHQPHYARAVQYHALHDISHTLIDNPLVRVPQIGCTAAAVAGGRTASGRLLVGRIFDFEGGRAFDRDKVVQRVVGDGDLDYLSVSWPGAIGVVTGLNRAGLWVSLNAADTATTGTTGRPIILAAREILATCRSIDDAVAVLRRTPVFIAENVVLASGPEDRAVVVEIAPGGCAIRPMREGRLVVTNHFETDSWAEDPVNTARRSTGTSTGRLVRAEALLSATDRCTPRDLLDLLRDRRGPGGTDLGFGNRGTINAWIGAHLVVADPAAGQIWVCGPWHGLGRAFAIGFDGPHPGEDLPADPERGRHDRDADRWEGLLRTAETLVQAGRVDDARAIARQGADLNPHHWRSHYVLALCAATARERAMAVTAALAAQPPYAADRALIQALGEGLP